MTVKKLLMLQGLAILGLIVGVAIPLGMPYDFNAPLCSTKEGMEAAKGGLSCQSCPGYSYWDNARMNIIEAVSGGRPVIINAGIIVNSTDKDGAGVYVGNPITIMHSTINRKGLSSVTLTTRDKARDSVAK